MFFGSGGGASGIFGNGRNCGFTRAAGVAIPPGSGLNCKGAFGGFLWPSVCGESGLPSELSAEWADEITDRETVITASSDAIERANVNAGRAGIWSL